MKLVVWILLVKFDFQVNNHLPVLDTNAKTVNIYICFKFLMANCKTLLKCRGWKEYNDLFFFWLLLLLLCFNAAIFKHFNLNIASSYLLTVYTGMQGNNVVLSTGCSHTPCFPACYYQSFSVLCFGSWPNHWCTISACGPFPNDILASLWPIQ